MSKITNAKLLALLVKAEQVIGDCEWEAEGDSCPWCGYSKYDHPDHVGEHRQDCELDAFLRESRTVLVKVQGSATGRARGEKSNITEIERVKP